MSSCPVEFKKSIGNFSNKPILATYRIRVSAMLTVAPTRLRFATATLDKQSPIS